MSTEKLQTFLGWCTTINFGLLFIGIVQITLIADWASELHSQMFGIDPQFARQTYFLYLAFYKLAIIIFNLMPYLALRIMSYKKSA